MRKFKNQEIFVKIRQIKEHHDLQYETHILNFKLTQRILSIFLILEIK